MLCLLEVLKNVKFPFGSTTNKLVILKPGMVCVKVTLRHFGELLHRLECVFLHPPKLPMVVSTCTHLVIVLRVESDLFDLLLLKIVLAEDSLLLDPVVSNCLAVHSVSDDESNVLIVVGKVDSCDSLLGWLVRLRCEYLRRLLLQLNLVRNWRLEMRLVLGCWLCCIVSLDTTKSSSGWERGYQFCHIDRLLQLLKTSTLHVVKAYVCVWIILVPFADSQVLVVWGKSHASDLLDALCLPNKLHIVSLLVFDVSYAYVFA